MPPKQGSWQWQGRTARRLGPSEAGAARLSKPEWAEPPEGSEPDEMWYGYDSPGPFPGELIAMTDAKTGLLLGIDLYPLDLTKEEAISYFGKEYRETR